MQDIELLKIVSSSCKDIQELENIGERNIRNFLSQGRINLNSKILDFGAGLGKHAIPLKRMGFNVTAIDRLQAMVDYLISKGVNAICSDNLDPVMHQRFDIVIATYVFQHLGKLRVKNLINQISQITNNLYFTLPTRSLWEKLPNGYFFESGSSDEIYENCECSYVYEDEAVIELLSNFKLVSLSNNLFWAHV